MLGAQNRLVDYHIHSTHSIDGQASIDELCRRAIELRIATIGFAEHVEFEPSDAGLSFFNYEAYSKSIEEAREKFRQRLIIKKGAEIDYGEMYEDEIRDWIRGKDFDFKIGSVHYISHIPFDLNKTLSVPAGAAVQEYYTKIKCAAQSGLFDVIGHFDYVKSYVPGYCDAIPACSDIIDLAFEQMIAKGVCLEINSRRKERGEPFPSRELIIRYLDRGGTRFSFGSDAHSVQALGIGIMYTMNLLRNLKPTSMKILFEE